MLELIFPSVSAVLTLAAVGTSFGLILSVAKQKLKVEKDPRIEQIMELLPGANCGACGMPGCSGYASKIVNEGLDVTLCPVGGSETTMQIAQIMGVDAGEGGIPEKARVRCQGGTAHAKKKFLYEGPKDCRAASSFMGGYRVCEYGCMGYGDCMKICPFDAIEMNDNDIPVVDLDKCTGCGKCVEACPRDIIGLVKETFDVYVICRNQEKGAVMRKGCSVGCIACNKCVKACKEVHADNPDIETAIEIVDFLAIIDYDKCINCGKCAEVCDKQKVISFQQKGAVVV